MVCRDVSTPKPKGGPARGKPYFSKPLRISRTFEGSFMREWHMAE